MDPTDQPRPPGPEVTSWESGAPEDDLEVQRAVRALLSSQPDPGPMPADVERRLVEALDHAATLRAADEGLMDELGMTQAAGPPADPTVEPTDADPSGLRLVGGAGDGGPGAVPGDPVWAGEEGPAGTRRWPVLLAAAALVALVVIAGSVVVHGLRSPNDGLASIPGVGSTGGSGGSSSSALHIQISETAYTEGTLPSLARALITTPGQPVSSTDAEAPAIGPLATTDGAGACLVALGEGDAPQTSIDLATYEGQPAAVIVIQRPAGSYAIVVQRGCTTGDTQVIQDAVAVP